MAETGNIMQKKEEKKGQENVTIGKSLAPTIQPIALQVS